MLNRLSQHSILPFVWIELILKSKCLILYKSMTLCIVEEEDNVVMKWTNSECTLAFTAWIGGVNHLLGPDEDPLQPSLLYGHPGLAREAVNTIYGTHFDKHLWWLDWTTGSTKASKIKQNGIIICNAERALGLAHSEIQSIWCLQFSPRGFICNSIGLRGDSGGLSASFS